MKFGFGPGGRRLVFAAATAVALLAGCASFQEQSVCSFVDEDGQILTVHYGMGKEDHETTFISPGNGKEMTMTSKLRVKVELPEITLPVTDEKTHKTHNEEFGPKKFMAFQCMNMLPSGTMYKSNNEEWMYHANGFMCTVYHQTDEEPPRYLEIYRGVLCQPQKKD